jgi:hypothetical protein
VGVGEGEGIVFNDTFHNISVISLTMYIGSGDAANTNFIVLV